MSNADKRIPVTEERWKQLHDLKEAGQTWDELLEELVRDRNRKRLAEKAKRVERTDADELTPLDDV